MSDYRLIPLIGRRGSGQYAKVSPEDYDALIGFNWHLTAKGYVMASASKTNEALGEEKHVLMHCRILQVPDGYRVDHRDGDGRNNTRGNLRQATLSQNGANRKRQESESKYKGVSFSNGIPVASICLNQKDTYLGRFNSETEAAKAYDAAARHYWGEFALTNFEGTDSFSIEEIKAMNPRPIGHSIQRSKKHGYYGVYYRPKLKQPWDFRAPVEGKTKVIARFDTKEDAARARDEYVKRHLPSWYPLNFPE